MTANKFHSSGKIDVGLSSYFRKKLWIAVFSTVAPFLIWLYLFIVKYDLPLLSRGPIQSLILCILFSGYAFKVLILDTLKERHQTLFEDYIVFGEVGYCFRGLEDDDDIELYENVSRVDVKRKAGQILEIVIIQQNGEEEELSFFEDMPGMLELLEQKVSPNIIFERLV